MVNFIALCVLAFGTLSGAIGSSSMFWTRREQENIESQATSPSGKERTSTQKLESRERFRDIATLIGWGLAFVGGLIAIFGNWPS